MGKFVMVAFNDGDYRVYTKRAANKRTIAKWNEGNIYIQAEVVAENKDKQSLVQMANLARDAYLEKEGLTTKEDSADYTSFGVFP